jgi:hypothetical protein
VKEENVARILTLASAEKETTLPPEKGLSSRGAGVEGSDSSPSWDGACMNLGRGRARGVEEEDMVTGAMSVVVDGGRWW